jgi:hypothetical protein
MFRIFSELARTLVLYQSTSSNSTQIFTFDYESPNLSLIALFLNRECRVHHIATFYQYDSNHAHLEDKELIEVYPLQSRESLLLKDLLFEALLRSLLQIFLCTIKVIVDSFTSFYPLMIALIKNTLTVSIFGRYASQSKLRKLYNSFFDYIFSVTSLMLTLSNIFYC